ncbi:MAG: prolipoprotein diacylglyceryl transferase [bacterium]
MSCLILMMNCVRLVITVTEFKIMFPILFKLGPITLHTYGLLVSIAFLVVLKLAIKQANKEGISSDCILDLSFYSLLAAIVGARIFFVILDPDFFSDPRDIYRVWQGGLVFYGGFIGAFVVGFWYIKKHNLPLWQTLDIFTPSLAIGQAIGRLGCLMAGCCHGKECHLPWAITFSNKNSLAPLGVPLHPTQLYSSLQGALIFLILINVRRKKPFHGFLVCLYIFLYSIFRFIVEIFRGDPRGFIFKQMFSTSQVVSLILFPLGIFLFFYLKRE